MSDNTKGLYRKFIVERADGRSAPGEKHENCEYFVLDVTHDPHAIPALRAYAISCQKDYPFLAQDLIAIVQAHTLEERGASEIRIATIRPDWKMPAPPFEKCADCGQPVKPHAWWMGDGFLLFWDCSLECGRVGEQDHFIDEWPFIEDVARVGDIEAAGFIFV